MTKPLTQDQIIQILKDNKWNVDEPDSLQDMIDLIRAVEKAQKYHVTIEPIKGWHLEWVPNSEEWPG